MDFAEMTEEEAELEWAKLFGDPVPCDEPEFDWDDPKNADPEPFENDFERYKYCGRKFQKNKSADTLSQFTFVCGDFRRCHWCNDEKSKQERLVIGYGLIEHKTNLIISECTDDEAKQLKRRQRDKESSYRSYPQPDGKTIVLHCDEEESGRVITRVEDFDDLPIGEWLKNIPKKKRVSGSNYMQATTIEEQSEEDKLTILNSLALWTDAPTKIQNELWFQAVQETPSPENIEELEKRVKQRLYYYKELLQEKKYVTYFVPIRIKITTENVGDWLKPPILKPMPIFS